MINLETIVHNWVEDRPTMKENNCNGYTLFELLAGEVGELLEAMQSKNHEEMKVDEEFIGELADVGLYYISILNMLGLDMNEICRDKCAYNNLRYPAKDYQNGDFHEAMAWNRLRVKREKLKEQYYAKEATCVRQ